MARYKLTVEYDGTGLVGWQRQDNGPSVQQFLEEAAANLNGGAPPVAIAAGRTDAGVHAMGQVVHIDLAADYAADRVRHGINFYLRPNPVAVRECEQVPDSFHARFSARERSYLYRIVNRRAPLVLDANRAWWVPKELDAEAMNEAAQRLVGHHDFTSFRAVECQSASPVKTLDELTVTRQGEEIHIRTRARSFLHHQVRNMVGTLRLAGEGKWTADDVTRALEARNRSAAGATAPACGLYFVGVRYDGD